MVRYDPFSDEIIRDPHPVYARMRDEAPAYRLDGYDAWALSRFEDVWECSAAARGFSVEQGNTTSHLLTKVQPPSAMFALMDPPGHTRVRAGVRGHFLPRAIAGLEPFARQWVKEAFEAAGDEIDVVQDLGTPLAVRVASRLIGISDDEGAEIVKLTRRFFRRDPEHPGLTPDGMAALTEMMAVFTRLAERRRASGEQRDDALGALLRVEIDGKLRSPEAVGDDLSLLMNGGTDTLPKVLANTVRRLWRHPDQRTLVLDDPTLVHDAFLEALRVDMPTQHLCRVLTEDRELHGEKLFAGETVLFLYASANRDPREFPDPEAYDVLRRPPRHLGFGHGAHACIGRHVAALEARVCLEALLERAPGYEVIEERAELLHTEFVQGFASLPVRLR